MALGRKKNCSSEMKYGSLKDSSSETTKKERLALFPSRKRVISDCIGKLSEGFPFPTLLKNSRSSIPHTDESLLEALPQDILVKILCGVDHDDLDHLFHVSNKIKDATMIAKQNHFAFSTPSSKTTTLRVFRDYDEESSSNEAPNAPKQDRTYKSRISEKKLAGITVALFRSNDEEEKWSRNRLLLETMV